MLYDDETAADSQPLQKYPLLPFNFCAGCYVAHMACFPLIDRAAPVEYVVVPLVCLTLERRLLGRQCRMVVAKESDHWRPVDGRHYRLGKTPSEPLTNA